MRKGFLMVLAVALVAVLAAPAVAGTDINGFYRAKGYVSNFKNGGAAPPSLKPNANNDDLNSNGFVEQRFRVRFSFGEENVKAVWFSEIDFGQWGDSAGNAFQAPASRNQGGALGGDKINLETKNVYVWFKVPDTSLDFTVGLQNQTDSFAGLMYGAADFAAIFATGKYEPISWKLGWGKLYENSTSNWDDMTLYAGVVNWAPSKDLKLGLSLYFIQDDTQKNRALTGLPNDNTPMFNNGASTTYNTTNGTYIPGSPSKTPYQPTLPGFYTIQTWTPGIDFAWNAGPVQLSGFLLAQFGTMKSLSSSNPDIDIMGGAIDLRIDANLGPGKLFVEGLAINGGDGTSNKYGSILTLSDMNASPGGNSAFTRLDYQILMGNGDDINQNQCLIGCAAAVASQSPGNSGRGMWTVGAGYSMKVAEKTTMKLGAGYLQAVQLLKSNAGFATVVNPVTGAVTSTMTGGPDSGRSKDMGTELNANVNYNIMKGLDFGLYAAYAWLGDFFKTNTGTASTSVVNPPDAYDLHFRLNYAF